MPKNIPLLQEEKTMMNFNNREKIIALTPLWKGERLPDGRPKVEDKYLNALYGMTLEEVWKPMQACACCCFNGNTEIIMNENLTEIAFIQDIKRHFSVNSKIRKRWITV